MWESENLYRKHRTFSLDLILNAHRYKLRGRFAVYISARKSATSIIYLR